MSSTMVEVVETGLEFIGFPFLYITVGFALANLIDFFSERVFQYIQKLFGISADNNAWLILEVIVQLLVTSVSNYQLRKIIKYGLLQISPGLDAELYGEQAYSVLFAFINFYGQDNLKRKMNRINMNFDAFLNKKFNLPTDTPPI